jgi:thymidine kinase
MAIAEYVTKVHAICSKTGNIANYSYRKNKEDSIILIGEKDEYEALSREIFYEKMNSKKKKT